MHTRLLALALTLLPLPALASPVFDALDKKRYGEAIAMASSGDPLLFSYARWATLSQPGGQAYLSFSDAAGFLREHRGWPQENRVRISVEAAQLRDNASGPDAEWMCNELKPISGRGMVACANLLNQTDSRVRALIKKGWLQGDFDASEERDILARYGHMLDANDHAARTERLLFEGKTQAALRMKPKLSSAARAIMDARIALIGGSRQADSKIASLSSSARQAPGIIFDRIRYRHKKGMEDGALDLFAQCPIEPPHGNSWWPLRYYYAREAMSRGQYSKALTIVGRTGDIDVEYKAEALWLSGWLKYEYLNRAREAQGDFQQLYNVVTTPVSKARAAYWAGRAAESSGNSSEARSWYERGAKYPTVFYGQLAYAKANPGEPLDLPSSVDGSGSNGPLARMASMLNERGDDLGARMFWQQAAAQTTDTSALAGLAERANRVQPGNGVRVAKEALRKNVILIKQGWPRVALPPDVAVEPALALAIARQESEFDPNAKSHAGATGLMQLLPGTARLVAKGLGVGYTPSDLYVPQSNLTLGSAYLAELLNKTGGSYVAAIAGYNAGPGNMLRWVGKNGHPGQSIDQTLRWIESIPFSETRNYVQRVIENLQVYRALANPDTPLAIERDLQR